MGFHRYVALIADNWFLTAANGVGLQPGTTPAIAAGTGGGYEIAFHAWGTGTLWTVTPDNVGHETFAPIADGASPSITTLSNSQYHVAYAGPDNGLRVRDDAGAITFPRPASPSP